jgi:hypothetical protein
MINEILYNESMNNDIETDWIPAIIENQNGQKSCVGASIMVSWDEVSGSFDGEIIIILSNDTEFVTIGKSISVNKSSSRADAELMIINPAFRFLKLIYHKNNITGGKLTSVLFY